MAKKLSRRLSPIVEALPLRPGLRVLEIGCGSGAVARAVASRILDGQVLAVDRSAKAIRQAQKLSQAEMAAGRLTLRQADVESFALEPGEAPFDIAFAVRVGALDGRHPKVEQDALRAIARTVVRHGHLYIDGGNPLQEISLEAYRS